VQDEKDGKREEGYLARCEERRVRKQGETERTRAAREARQASNNRSEAAAREPKRVRREKTGGRTSSSVVMRPADVRLLGSTRDSNLGSSW